MRFETLREFIIVAKHLNITKAAQELYLSQPSLSGRIAALEKELGYEINKRIGITGVELFRKKLGITIEKESKDGHKNNDKGAGKSRRKA